MTPLAASSSHRLLEKEQGSTWKQTVQDYCALLAFSGLLWSVGPRGQHPPSQKNEWNRQPASVLTDWLTTKVQNSYPAQASGYARAGCILKKRFKKNGYTQHIGESRVHGWLSWSSQGQPSSRGSVAAAFQSHLDGWNLCLLLLAPGRGEVGGSRAGTALQALPPGAVSFHAQGSAHISLG